MRVVCCSVCTIHHLQKTDKPDERWDLFVSFWFIVVTFSTVGYGKIAPEMWSSRLFVILMILAALVIVPKQVRCNSQLIVKPESLKMVIFIEFIVVMNSSY